MGAKKKTATEAFGRVLRQLREKKGLTQEALALEADTERSHISALERAEKGPTLGTILSLAQPLGASAGDLVSMVEEAISQKKRSRARRTRILPASHCPFRTQHSVLESRVPRRRFVALRPLP